MYYVVLKKGTQYYVVCEGKGGGVYPVKVDIKEGKPNLSKKHKIAYLEKKDADNWKKNKAFDVEVIPKGKLVSSNAVHELKRLYLLNPDLAHKAAKVLGYRITASKIEFNLPAHLMIGDRESDRRSAKKGLMEFRSFVKGMESAMTEMVLSLSKDKPGLRDDMRNAKKEFESIVSRIKKLDRKLETFVLG